MNIGMLHQRTGGKCGVALEMDKWAAVLHELGHEVCYCTGEGPGYCIEELALDHPAEKNISDRAFYTKTATDEELRKAVTERVRTIKPLIEGFLDENKVDLLIVQNIWSVVSHVGTGISLARIAQERDIDVWAHNHDFFWNFRNPLVPQCPYAQEVLETYFPPDLDNITHFVINSFQQEQMKKRRGIQSHVVPNVFDPDAVKTSCSEKEEKEFRDQTNLKADDLVILCGTRILFHKFIEAAIHLVKELDSPENRKKLQGAEVVGGGTFNPDSRIVFISAGKEESFSGDYKQGLQRMAEELGIESRWIGERLSGAAAFAGEDLGKLFDVYCHSDIITYTTTHEGWGNQLLEAVAACKPVVITEYPVYQKDIKQFGFDLISIGTPEQAVLSEENTMRVPNGDSISNAAQECIDVLTGPDNRQSIVKGNLEIMENNLSLDTLKDVFLKYLS